MELPSSGPAGHLVGYLFKVGPAIAGEVLTFTEIRNWTELTGVTLNAWEAETLRSLSSAYLSELEAAKSPARAAPSREPEEAS